MYISCDMKPSFLIDNTSNMCICFDLICILISVSDEEADHFYQFISKTESEFKIAGFESLNQIESISYIYIWTAFSDCF